MLFSEYILVSFKKGLTLLHYRWNTLQFKMVPQCNRILKYNIMLYPLLLV
jgi:hypothetical protein